MSRPNWIGKTLGGRYRIDKILGHGGMSAVYQAYDPNLKRVVAIKLIHAHLADDPKFLSSFEEEAAAVAQLRHPNIVQVFDFDHDEELYYMVQEFVAGETLQERLRRLNREGRRLPFAEAIRYTIDIADAVGYAHKRGMIHRDIKPANIMLDVHNQAILMDFGIVKIEGGERHTTTGAVIGTALYLPPELIRGQVPDPRSDMYSLGITLFEMVSGKPPFESDSAMTLMMMHLNDPLPDLRQLRPEVPEDLIEVIQKSLAKEREQRYPSMAELATALRGILNHLSAGTSSQTTQAGAEQENTFGPTKTGIATAGLSSPGAATLAGPDTETSSEPQAGIATEIAPADVEAGDGTTHRQATSTEKPGTDPVIVPPPAGAEALQEPAQPASATVTSATATRKKPHPAIWIGGAVALLVIIVAGIFLVTGSFGSGNGDAGGATTPSNTAPLVAVVVASDTPTPTLTSTPTILPTPSPTSPPTTTPTITQSPTPTIPVGVPYSRINDITVNDKGLYVVDYETFEYTEKLPGQHVHFFFNTVSQEQAGKPGNGPSELYGGPRPFEGYRTSDRPAAATQMCIRVANSDHSIQLDSGNCFILPDVNAATPIFDDPCLAGPDQAYPTLAQLEAGQVLLVTGISPDEAWWTVDNPNNPGQSCWLQRDRSDFSGDLSTLPLAEVPPPPEGKLAQIIQITLDAQGRYVVEFVASGFTPALPGTHMHFYFNIFTADQVGGATGGNRLMYGGTSPFTGYAAEDRPAEATQMCVLVANPGHSVILESGNCFQLPDVPLP